MLRTARELGIGITFGSDAHEPGHVGESFQEAAAAVRAAGYATYRVYTKRRFEERPLP
jgi:histidinol-phosphatase (PHP family)